MAENENTGKKTRGRPPKNPGTTPIKQNSSTLKNNSALLNDSSEMDTSGNLNLFTSKNIIIRLIFILI